MAGQWWRQYIFAAFANLGLTVAGFALGWSSPAFSKLTDVDQSPLDGPISSDEEAWIGSLLPVGAALSPALAGLAASKIGRKWGLVGAALPFLTGSFLKALGNDVALIYTARIFWGMGVGMVFTLSPMYCAEIATDDARGALGSFLQVFISLGFLIVYSVGPFVSYQLIGYISIAVVLVFAVCVFIMPESPVFYIGKDDLDLAADSLVRIRGCSRAEVQTELDKMVTSLSSSTTHKASLSDLFKGSTMRAFLVSLGLVSLMQMSGITPVFIYLTIIFEAAQSNLDPAIATIIVGAFQLAASPVSAVIVDRLGRRALLLFSCCGCTIAHFISATYFTLEENSSPAVDSIRFLPIVGLVLYVAMYNWGLGPLPFAVAGELLPVEVKAYAMPLVTTIYWAIGFLLTRYFTPLANIVGMSVPFWILGSFCFVTFFFVLFFLPETKGKSYQEIQELLANRSRT